MSQQSIRPEGFDDQSRIDHSPGNDHPAPSGGAVSARDQRLDALLDDIDEILSVNAEEFVKGFVQKGGQ